MRDETLSVSSKTNIKVLHDGKAAFAFVEDPARVTLIGPLALAICLLISDAGSMSFSQVKSSLVEKAHLSQGGDLKFENAIVCALGQLVNLRIIAVL